MLSHVFYIPVPGRWLVHAPLHGVTALVNAAAIRSLCGGGIPGASNGMSELREALACEPESCAAPPDGDLRPQFLGLIPTRGCNLACVYCGFGSAHAPTNDRMDYATAVTAVDWMADHAAQRGVPTLEVHFFGGEPFSASDVVEVALHRARAVAAEKQVSPRFEVATNGVYDERRAEFVGDYFDSVVLSLDGPEEIQDLHRPYPNGRGAYHAVARTARILSQSPTELCLRVCVTNKSVARLEEIAVWLCDQFQPSAVNFETLKCTPASSQAGLFAPDPYDFATRLVRAARLVRQGGVEAVYAAADSPAPRRSFCPVGNDVLIVSPDGSIAGCYLLEREWRERGLDLNLGKILQGRVVVDPSQVVRLRRLTWDKPRCRRCFCQWQCAGGCHVANTPPGADEAYSDFCIQTRIIYACRLLEQLEGEEAADELLRSRSTLESLSNHPTDLLGEGPRP